MEEKRASSTELDQLPGFRFHPTEEELLEFYLKGVVYGKKLSFDIIGTLNLYRHDPWELPGITHLDSLSPSSTISQVACLRAWKVKMGNQFSLSNSLCPSFLSLFGWGSFFFFPVWLGFFFSFSFFSEKAKTPLIKSRRTIIFSTF